MKEELQNLLIHARYLLCRTYPLIQEQKLFLDVFRILLKYYYEYEQYLLELLRIKGIISNVPLDPVLCHQLLLFHESQLSQLIKANFELTSLITQKSLLQELLEAQKTGPADFARKKDYIICEKNYKVRVINESFTLQVLRTAEEFGKFL